MPRKKLRVIKKHASEPALVFLHIPKTGGTTLHHHFSAHFTPDEICPEKLSTLDNFSVDELRQWRFFSGHFNADEIKRIPRPIFLVAVLRDPIERLISLYFFWKRHRADFVEQHGLIGLQIAKAGSLADFLRSDHPAVLHATLNTMTHQLAGAVLPQPEGYTLMKDGAPVSLLSEGQLLERALETLLTFDVVGDSSSLVDVYRSVAKVFGMAPLNELSHLNTKHDENEVLGPYEPETITPEILSLLEERTRLDRLLYRFSGSHGLLVQPAKKAKNPAKSSIRHPPLRPKTKSSHLD